MFTQYLPSETSWWSYILQHVLYCNNGDRAARRKVQGGTMAASSRCNATGFIHGIMMITIQSIIMRLQGSFNLLFCIYSLMFSLACFLSSSRSITVHALYYRKQRRCFLPVSPQTLAVPKNRPSKTEHTCMHGRQAEVRWLPTVDSLGGVGLNRIHTDTYIQ